MNKHLTRERFAGRLRTRLFVFVALALLVLTLSLTGVSSYVLIQRLKSAEETDLLNSVKTRCTAVGEWRNHSLNLAMQVTSRTRIRQELERYAKGEISLSQLQEFTAPKIEDAMNISEKISGICRLGPKNEIIAQCGLSHLLTNLEGHLKDIPDIHTPSLTPPMLLNGIPYNLAIAPIFGKDSQRIGTDILMLKTASLLKLIHSPNDAEHKMHACLGYLKDGKAHAFFPEIHQNHNQNNELPDHNFRKQYLGLSLAANNGVTRNGNWIIAYSPVNGTNWGMTLSQDSASLFSPVFQELRTVILISAFIYVLVLLIFWQIMQPLAGKILLHIDELEEEVAVQTSQLHQEIHQHEITESEKEEVISQLQEALDNVKTLQGLLPICSYCKKIRDDQGYWSVLETYMRNHSDAEFSHSICPDCMQVHFPELKDMPNTEGNLSSNQPKENRP